jgi:hypothetical protein
MYDDLEIPAFLKREPVPAGSVTLDLTPKRERAKRVTAKEQFERDVHRIAYRRWQNGTVDQYGGRRFQNYRTIAKAVRAELKQRDAVQAGRGK